MITHLAKQSVAIAVALMLSAVTARADMIGYWNLNEGAGQTVGDSSANSNTGILGNSTSTTTYDPAWDAAGMFGAALDFTYGQSQRVEIANHSSLNAEKLTVSFWVKAETANYQIPVDRLPAAGGTDGWTFKFRTEAQDRKVWLVTGNLASSAAAYGSETSPYTLGQWDHIVGTWDSDPNNDGSTADGALRLYVNGVMAGSKNNVNQTPSATMPIRFGTPAQVQSSEQFDGLIDDVAMWDQALTPRDVAAIYNGGQLGLPADDVILGAPDTGNTGPGGIERTDFASNLIYWLKADDGVTKDGSDRVSLWADQAGHGNDFAQGTEANQPLLEASVMGGNNLPAVRFDGDRSDGFNTIDKLVMGSETAPETIIAVNRIITATSLGGLIGRNTADAGIRMTSAGKWQFPGNLSDFTSADGSMFINGVSGNDTTVGTAHILSTTRGSAHNNNYTTTGLGQYFYNADRVYIGDIAEVLAYSRQLNAAEIAVVENSLSAKYDLPIANDHYAGDESAQGDYDLDVIGIGRLDTSNALTSSGGAGLGIQELGDTLDDGEWLLAGHKTPVNSWVTTDLPGPANQRSDRVWYLDATGDLGAELYFDLSDLGLSAPAAGTPFGLLFSQTNAFDFEVLALASNVTGDLILFNLPQGTVADGYYTLAAVPEPASCLLLALGLIGLSFLTRRSRRPC